MSMASEAMKLIFAVLDDIVSFNSGHYTFIINDSFCTLIIILPAKYV